MNVRTVHASYTLCILAGLYVQVLDLNPYCCVIIIIRINSYTIFMVQRDTEKTNVD